MSGLDPEEDDGPPICAKALPESRGNVTKINKSLLHRPLVKSFCAVGITVFLRRAVPPQNVASATWHHCGRHGTRSSCKTGSSVSTASTLRRSGRKRSFMAAN
jgi:hypothetical protein